MQAEHNKENIKSTNTLYSRQTNKSKANLFDPSVKSTQGIPSQHYGDDLSLKIYQERMKNKFIYDKIKAVDGFFSYELRACVKGFNSEDMLVREYGKLLEQYQFLEKHWAKIEVVIDANTQKQNASFQFLLAPWHKKPSAGNIPDSTQILQRLNKTVLFIKKQIDSSLKQTKHSNQHLSYQELVNNSPEHIELRRELELAHAKLRLKEEQLAQKEEMQVRELSAYRRENQVLNCKVSELEAKIKEYVQRQKELYSTINKLSKQFLQKQGKRQVSKNQKDILRRYISDITVDDNNPLFEILVKAKNSHLQNKNTIIISKSLEEIELFFDNITQNQQEKQKRCRQSFSSEISIDQLLQTPSNSKSNDQIQHLSNQQTSQLDFSSTKKRKISLKRQIYSGTKLFPKKVSEDYQELAKELKFIRKR